MCVCVCVCESVKVYVVLRIVPDYSMHTVPFRERNKVLQELGWVSLRDGISLGSYDCSILILIGLCNV